jgi:hypothetical protein
MSYNMQIWSVIEPVWNEIASGLDGWIASNQGLTFESRTWQIVVGPCSRVEGENIPEEVFSSLPGIRYLTEINLEPIHAPGSAHTHLSRISSRIARVCQGIFLDPQQDTIASPRGVRRLSPNKPKGRISVLSFAWWFDESPLIEQGGFAGLLLIMEKYLPEALPRRYGPYEPPQYHYEAEGKDHFITFLAAEKTGVVWYPHYPVFNIGLGIYNGFGPRRIGYISNALDIDVDASVCAQPGWNVALRRFWSRMSDFIRPYYGEVRLMRNYILQRGRVYLDGRTETHPIRNGWWNGVPRRMGAAVVIGERYARLWPEFVKRSEQRNGLMFLSVDNWASGEGVDRIVGGVPSDIAQGKYAARFTYPKAWPFEYPFADD